jgi:hypothetical protein
MSRIRPETDAGILAVASRASWLAFSGGAACLMTLTAAAYPSACRSGGDPTDVKLGDQLGVVEHVDRYRAVTDDCEREHRERLLAVECDYAGGAVDQRRANIRRKSPGRHCASRDSRGAVQLERLAVAAVGAEHHIWVEDRHQRLEVALPGGREVGVDDCLLAREIRRRRGVAHAAAARLASWRVAWGERSTIAAISLLRRPTNLRFGPLIPNPRYQPPSGSARVRDTLRGYLRKADALTGWRRCSEAAAHRQGHLARIELPSCRRRPTSNAQLLGQPADTSGRARAQRRAADAGPLRL